MASRRARRSTNSLPASSLLSCIAGPATTWATKIVEVSQLKAGPTGIVGGRASGRRGQPAMPTRLGHQAGCGQGGNHAAPASGGIAHVGAPLSSCPLRCPGAPTHLSTAAVYAQYVPSAAFSSIACNRKRRFRRRGPGRIGPGPRCVQVSAAGQLQVMLAFDLARR